MINQADAIFSNSVLPVSCKILNNYAPKTVDHFLMSVQGEGVLVHGKFCFIAGFIISD